MPVEATLVYDVVHNYETRLKAYVRRRFSNFGPERIDDVVQGTWEQVLLHPERLSRAQDQRWLWPFLVTVAFREANRVRRRASYRKEVGVMPTAGVEPAVGSGVELWVDIQRRLDKAIRASAMRVCSKRVDALEAAVWDRFVTGDSDTVVARRHELSREYLCRAKNEVLRRLGWREETR